MRKIGSHHDPIIDTTVVKIKGSLRGDESMEKIDSVINQCRGGCERDLINLIRG
jgi:hypothetical protein